MRIILFSSNVLTVLCCGNTNAIYNTLSTERQNFIDDTDNLPDFFTEPLPATKRPYTAVKLSDEDAQTIASNVECGPMFETKWKLSKANLYENGNLPTSNFYYIGKWKNAAGKAIRNPSKNCWRYFTKQLIQFDSAYINANCKAKDDDPPGTWDCEPFSIKNDTSSQQSFNLGYEVNNLLSKNKRF